MTTYDKIVSTLGQAAIALIGLQATDAIPKGYLPVWLVIAAWVVSHVAQASTNAMVKVPVPGAGKVGVLLLSLGLVATPSCATFGPMSDRVISCAGVAMVDVIDDVAAALLAGDFERIGQLAKAKGFDVVACAVQRAGSEARHLGLSGSDPKASAVERNATKWITDNGVSFR